MKDYDAKESWIKQFSYEGLLRAKWIGTRFESILQGFKVVQEYLICSCFYLLKNGDILLVYKCRALVSYDPRDGTSKDLLLPGMPIWFEGSVHEGA